MKTIGNMYRSLTSGQIDDLKRRTEQVNRGEACPSLQAEPSQPKEIGCITTGEIVVEYSIVFYSASTLVEFNFIVQSRVLTSLIR